MAHLKMKNFKWQSKVGVYGATLLQCIAVALWRQLNEQDRQSRLKKSNKMQQNAEIYLLLNYSTCFGRPSHPSSRVHKAVVAASGTDYTIWETRFFKLDQISPYLVTFEEACFPVSMICTRGCNYNFMHYWWWARWTPETCRVIQQ